MDNVEAANVLLTVNNDAGPTHVATTGDYDDITGIKLDKIRDLVLFDIELDSVVGLDAGVRVANSSTIVGNNVGDTLGTDGHFSDLEKLVASFLRCDAVDRETTLNVVEKAEVFTRLLNGDDVWKINVLIRFFWIVLKHPKNRTHETSGVGRVRPDLPVNLD